MWTSRDRLLHLLYLFKNISYIKMCLDCVRFLNRHVLFTLWGVGWLMLLCFPPHWWYYIGKSLYSCHKLLCFPSFLESQTTKKTHCQPLLGLAQVKLPKRRSLSSCTQFLPSSLWLSLFSSASRNPLQLMLLPKCPLLLSLPLLKQRFLLLFFQLFNFINVFISSLT